MFTSFSTALSALSAQSVGIDVVGNNLANLNTTGFKTSTVSFHDLVTQSLGAGLGDTQVGFGVGRPVTLRQFSQGAIQSTNGPLDVAIQGDGFLVVRGGDNNTMFTRGGNLQVDKAGFLMTSTGQRVQGWTGQDGVVNTNAPVGDIGIPVGTVRPPKLTSGLSLDLNLNAAAVEGTPGGKYSSSMNVYDSMGLPHLLTFSFEKTATDGEWTATVTSADGTVQEPAAPITLTFDSDGKLTAPAADAPVSIEIDGLPNGAAPLTMSWSLYDDNGQPRVTQFAQASAVSANAQDGFPPAQLVRVGVGDGGVVLAQYSNGQQSVVGQLAMAAIRNPESLLAVGDNNFQLSANSALPAVGVPGTGGRGTILGGAVESSTVDIAREFTNLIVLQRGYQASAKVITTVDEMSQETLNLKR